MNQTPTNNSYKLIVTILGKGEASKVVASSKNAGAKGGTILLGRGTASESMCIEVFGMSCNPEREIILTLAEKDMVDSLLKVISDEGKLNEPGKGIAFVIPVKGLAGIIDLLKMQ